MHAVGGLARPAAGPAAAARLLALPLVPRRAAAPPATHRPALRTPPTPAQLGPHVRGPAQLQDVCALPLLRHAGLPGQVGAPRVRCRRSGEGGQGSLAATPRSLLLPFLYTAAWPASRPSLPHPFAGPPRCACPACPAARRCWCAPASPCFRRPAPAWGASSSHSWRLSSPQRSREAGRLRAAASWAAEGWASGAALRIPPLPPPGCLTRLPPSRPTQAGAGGLRHHARPPVGAQHDDDRGVREAAGQVSPPGVLPQLRQGCLGGAACRPCCSPHPPPADCSRQPCPPACPAAPQALALRPRRAGQPGGGVWAGPALLAAAHAHPQLAPRVRCCWRGAAPRVACQAWFLRACPRPAEVPSPSFSSIAGCCKMR